MSLKNKILLILPRTGPLIIEPPFGLLCLSASLKKAGFEPVIWDSRFDNYKTIFDKHDEKSVLAAGLTVMTGPQIYHALKISRFIKQRPDIPVIWGGVHPTLLPEQTLAEPSIDHVVMGYGEVAFPRLLKALAGGKEVGGIPDIAFRAEGRVTINPRTDEAQAVPLEFDWDAVDPARYLQSNYMFGTKVLSLYTSHGCPHNCTFCYGAAFHSKKWRAQSPAAVLADIDKLRRRCGFDAVYFHDDNFFVDKPRAMAIAGEMKTRGLPFGVTMRADYADDGLFRYLKECGCAQVDWATESGSQRILDLYKKGITLGDIEKNAALTAKYHIGAYTAILMGHPEETPGEMMETLDLADRMMAVNPELRISDIKILTPYPGTEIYREAAEKGHPLPKSLEEWGGHFWNTTNLSPAGNRKFLDTITIVSLLAFCDWRIKKKNPVYNFLLGILHTTSLLRWRRRYFKYPFEIYLCRAALYVLNRI